MSGVSVLVPERERLATGPLSFAPSAVMVIFCRSVAVCSCATAVAAPRMAGVTTAAREENSNRNHFVPQSPTRHLLSSPTTGNTHSFKI